MIAKAGVRCVRLVPLQAPPPRELGRHRDRDGRRARLVPEAARRSRDRGLGRRWMRLLLDTCTLLWAWAEPGKLSERVQGLLEDPHNKVWVSAASAWEIATQHRLGNYPAGSHVIEEWDDRLAQDGFRQLTIAATHALARGLLAQPPS